MKIILSSVVIAALIGGCTQTNFGGGAAKKADESDVLPSNGIKNDVGEPLDISSTEQNEPVKNEIDGPRAAEGERLSKTIDLDCDSEAGSTIEIIDDGVTAPPGTETEPGKETKPGDESGFDPNGEPKKLGLIGSPEIDTQGKPIGGKPTEGKPLPEKPTETVPKDSRVIAKVKGKFCPNAKAKMTVLFVVDFSGSMGRHVPERGGDAVDGNDPQVNGTCGRLEAARAIIDRISKEKGANDQVSIGMVPFAGGIVTNKIMEITDFDSFAANVSKDTFCQYVVQNASFGYDPQNPGGINGRVGLLNAVDSSTNYRAAFQAAESLLTNVYGRKVVYFISDGQPTSGGQDPVAAGIEAGAKLRENVDNLIMNGLLLGDVGPEARQVLEGVTGSPERVRNAEQASELAEKILDFPAASIDPATALAVLTAAPYKTEKLGFHFFGEHPTDKGIWIYETQPFVLVGKRGETILHVVDVKAEGGDGSTHAARVEIRYTQK
jgi:hypothetical protein